MGDGCRESKRLGTHQQPGAARGDDECCQETPHGNQQSLRDEIHELEKRLHTLQMRLREGDVTRKKDAGRIPARSWDTVHHGLDRYMVERYSRQIILPSFGVRGQSNVSRGSVLVIGAGGLGSPALLYLAAAGVGRIGIVDRDCVELSNMHRQVLHKEHTVGMHKTTSAKRSILELNSSIQVEEYMDGFTPENALEIVDGYDVVLDASDNAPTRYLISDACCVAKKPLVSGAAIGTDGQLTVYCHGDDGPCYRCLYPTPPPATSCARCSDAGVLGPTPGIIGTMQSMEVLKILSGIGEVLSKKMLIMDALYSRYMVVTLRRKCESCASCGETPEITRETLPLFDYCTFTGQPSPSDAAAPSLHLVEEKHRITVQDLAQRMHNPKHLVLDVRPSHHFDICSIPGSINAPMTSFDASSVIVNVFENGSYEEVSVICRRGNQSQKALLELHKHGLHKAVDVIGGMQAWSAHIDDDCPIY